MMSEQILPTSWKGDSNLDQSLGFFAAVSLVISILLPSTAYSASDSCFCMVNDQDVIWWDCREAKKLAHTDILCLAEEGRSRVKFDTNGFGRVEGGDGPCKPCEYREGPGAFSRQPSSQDQDSTESTIQEEGP